MAKKKLEGKQQVQFEKMVMEGKTPEDISKHFGIAVSSVHNYKRALRNTGTTVPDVRGKRPSNIPPVPVETIMPESEAVSTSTVSQDLHGNYVKITIDNVVFYISALAKSVSIEQNTLQVRF